MKEKNKKVWIIVIAAVCAGVLSFALLWSNTFISYRMRLDSDIYEIENEDSDDIAEVADMLNIDEKDYGISQIMMVTRKSNGQYACILKCGSAAKAKKFVQDNDHIFDMFEDYYSSIDVDAETKGRFVIAGSSQVVDAVLG